MLSPSILEIIDRAPQTTQASTPVKSVMAQMSQTRASCILVLAGDRLAGIFTERDLVRLIAAQTPLQQLQIADLMTPQVVTATEADVCNNDVVGVLTLLRQNRIRHLPIVNGGDRVVGLITHQSIRRILQPIDFMKLRRVAEVMNPQVICAPLHASVLELAQLMSDRCVSCTVIVERASTRANQLELSIPVGIVTERDIVQFRTLDLDLAQTPAETVMSTPLFPMQPQDSLWEAHQQMQKLRVQRLVVTTQAGCLLGIITQTSLLQALDPMEMRAEIEVLQTLLKQSETQRESLLKQLMARNQLLESIAMTDSLTGLPNRRVLDRVLTQAIERAYDRESQSSDTDICLFALDVDRFKQINDTYGHPGGDRVLKAIAQCLQSHACPNSIVYRYGGEEFVCLTPGLTPKQALEYGERLREAVAELSIPLDDDRHASVTISIGGAIANPNNAVDAHQLLHQADQALYRAKHDGRNCVRMSFVDEQLLDRAPQCVVENLDYFHST
jgi:diguanylate cyclase (GGDEF)-like protein